MDGHAHVPVSEDTITVFLLDDHELVRRGVRTLLECEPGIEVIGEAGSAVEGEARITALRPRVAIVDGRLPDGSGIEVCRQVRSVDKRIEVLVLTSYDDDDALFAAIMAGASGYVLKQISSGDLVTAVRRVAAGQSMLDPAVTATVLERLRTAAHAEESGAFSELTDQERRVLAHLAQGESNREIALAMDLAEKTVRNYVSNILAKLSLTSRAQAAAFAIRNRLSELGREPHD